MDDAATALIDDLLRVFPHRRKSGDVTLICGRPLGAAPWELAAAFADKLDWTILTGAFLDAHAAALCRLPDAARCFYLPAFLITDLRGETKHANPVGALLHGLVADDRDACLADCDANLDGAACWDKAVRCWAHLSPQQATSVTHYLERRASDASLGERERARILEGLGVYWHRRRADTPSQGEHPGRARDKRTA